jgi:hypothetical protein
MNTGAFQVLDAANPDDRRQWITAWEAWPEREVFAHPDYVALEATGEGCRAIAAVLQLPEGGVLYPMLERIIGDGPHRDVTSPYGYGGPFHWGDVGRENATRFWDAFDEWARGERVVSEFVRFALPPTRVLSYPGTVERRQDNVARSLAPSLDEMWMEFEAKVRKNVKRAQRDGIEIVHDGGERLDDFLAIYLHTMQRRGAGDRYRFSREYFERLRAGLASHFRYFHALLNGRVVSSELVLVSADSVYSFLGGTREEAFEHRPNDLLKHAIIAWARDAGKQRFVLGGGLQPDDGIFRYKLAFAPAGRTPFCIGTRILDERTYATLATARLALAEREGRLHDAGFFPAYRA